MNNALPTVYCPNLRCRAANSEDDHFCHKCGEAIPIRYLWATGKQAAALPVGTLLANRFLVRAPRILLETQPGLPANGNVDVTDQYLPYLRLFGYRLHIPELYCLVPYGDDNRLITLLEGAPLCAADWVNPENPDPNIKLSSRVTLAQPFQEAWPQASPLRQLHWLWQIAHLWQPLSSQRVVASLLNLKCLRVETALLRLRELTLDPGQPPTLAELGQFWQQHLLGTSADMVAYLDQLCTRMIDGSIYSAEQLIAQLDAQLAQLQPSYPIKVDVAARTDTGPGREHNEDACYPAHGTVAQNTPNPQVIVCDGVGGHAGGEVASQLAIAATQAALAQQDFSQTSPDKIVAILEAAILDANEQIYQQNDAEHRLDRQRMGTTLVMALVHQNQLYLAHVGDSRAYRITRANCFQVTVDDDIASREVRLGYLPYRDALRYPGSGSLIQALGMAPRQMLRPTVQRFILDEDCIFLLCSDGLSDYERVDALWQSEIVPLLEQKTDLITLSKRLIDQANQLNGHDNVTVGILHCSTRFSDNAPTLQLGKGLPLATPANLATTLIQPAVNARKWLLIPGLLLLLLVSGALAYLAWNATQRRSVPEPSPSVQDPAAVPVPPEPAPTPAIQEGDLFELQPLPNQDRVALRLWDTPTSGATSQNFSLYGGSILQVVQIIQPSPDPTAAATPADSWLRVKVCHTPVPVGGSPEPLASSPTTPLSSQPRANQPFSGQQPLNPEQPYPAPMGWVHKADLQDQLRPLQRTDLDVSVQQACPDVLTRSTQLRE